MKIIWISHFLLYPATGYGALQRSRNLLKELSGQNDIYLISFYRDCDLIDNNTLQKARQNLQQYCESIHFLPHSHNNNNLKKYLTLIQSIYSRKPYSILIHNDKALLDCIKLILKKENIDLLYSDTLGLCEPLLPNYDLPCIINHHNIESDMMLRRAKKENSLINQLFLRYEAFKIKLYEKKYCHMYNQNIVVSLFDKEILLSINQASTVEVIENGVDCNYFKFHLRKKLSNKIIFTGGLNWYPNVEGMLYFCKDIWPLLIKAIPGVTLNIIGKSPPEKLLKVVSKFNNIATTGFVPDLREYMKDASIFICPILDGGGTRLKILDAMAQGIPIVSSSLGCEGIDVVDGENIYIANHPKEYVEKIKILINSLDEQNRIAKNAYHLIKSNYSYQVIGAKFNQVFKKIQREN